MTCRTTYVMSYHFLSSLNKMFEQQQTQKNEAGEKFRFKNKTLFMGSEQTPLKS